MKTVTELLSMLSDKFPNKINHTMTFEGDFAVLKLQIDNGEVEIFFTEVSDFDKPVVEIFNDIVDTLTQQGII